MLLIAVASMPVLAADADKATKQQERRLRQMMQQVQAEKAQLQSQFEQEKARLQADTQAEQAKSAELKNSISHATRKQALLSAELETLRQDKARLQAEAQVSQTQLQSQIQDLQQRLTMAEEALRHGESERAQMQATIVRKQQQLNASREKNSKLYDFGLQLIKVYEQPSLYQKVMRNEPFTQLKRVELENILQDYKDKIDDARLGAGDIAQ